MSSNRLYGPSGVPGGAGLLARNTSGVAAAVLPATQTITDTNEAVILNPSLSSATQALVLNIPATSPLDGQPFEVLASGRLNLGTSSTVEIKLYSGSSTTVGSNTLLKTSGAMTAFSGKSNWWVKAKLMFDSDSGKLNGTLQFMCNNVLVAEAAITNVPTGISNSNNPVLSFVLSFKFASAGTQVVYVKEFAANF
jgi:hypothetical protein